MSAGWSGQGRFSTPLHFLAGPVQFRDDASGKAGRKFVADLLPQSACCAKRRWCGSQGSRPQTRQGCFATNRRCCLSRSRLVSGRVSTLLSMRERVSSFAAGVSNSAGWGGLIRCRLDLGELGRNASLTLSPSSGVRLFAFGHARSVRHPDRRGSQSCDPASSWSLRIAEVSPDRAVARSPLAPFRGPGAISRSRAASDNSSRSSLRADRFAA